jgi:hypothetical protein
VADNAADRVPLKGAWLLRALEKASESLRHLDALLTSSTTAVPHPGEPYLRGIP